VSAGSEEPTPLIHTLGGEAHLDPDFAPSGRLAYTRRDGNGTVPSLWAWSARSGSDAAGYQSGLALSQPDWQPCVAGVTTSCTSVAPIPTVPAPVCPATRRMTAIAGWVTLVPLTCTGLNVRYELLEPPANGTVAHAGSGRLTYQARSGFAGQDTFTYRAIDSRGLTSATGRVNVTVTAPRPRPVRPAAPKLTVLGTPRLDRRGRALLQARCDRACTVKLRLRVTLHTGRMVSGRAVTANAPAGGTVSLRLKRGKVPARRRIRRVSVVGFVRGADGRERNFSLALRR
jgi:hypothetical protein